jgi:TolB protein
MAQTNLISKLEILDLSTLQRTVIFEAPYLFEAPNWTPDGKWLVFNSKGLIYKILTTGGTPEQITPNGPSYLHGWSPDGKELVYCAARNNKYDVYTISINGGEEKQLTNVEGLDDGPEYSPDGKYIYFNSTRTGLMQLWRMKTDGSEQTQLTFDQANNWFPHISHDNKTIVFLTYDKDVDGHPANKNVRLRTIPVSGGEPQTIIELFGGQGTINVNSWSPDNTKIAFVSYQLAQ